MCIRDRGARATGDGAAGADTGERTMATGDSDFPVYGSPYRDAGPCGAPSAVMLMQAKTCNKKFIFQ